MAEFSEEFIRSYAKSADYPRNLLNPSTNHYNLVDYANRLEEYQDDLFSNDDSSSVDIRDLKNWQTGFQDNSIRGVNGIHKTLLPEGYSKPIADPICRFIFLKAPHSRARLNISKDMFVHLLTYLQVMPTFLDFVFPFGYQIDQRDTHFGGSRFQCAIDPQDRDPCFPELARSGHGFQQCYSLKSIEAARGYPSWPWVMRQTAVWHAFDLEHGTAKWIMLKANKRMQERVNSTVGVPKLPAYNPIANAFAMSLATHLIPCEWATEHWRWYLSFIEQEIRKTTQRALTIKVDQPVEDFNPKTPSRVATMLSQSDESLDLMSSWRNTATNYTQRLWNGNEDKDEKALYDMTAEKGPQNAKNLQSDLDHTDQEISFSFDDVQQIQYIEEKIDEVGMVLGSNISVLSAIRNQHLELWDAESFPSDVRHACKSAFTKYQRRMAAIIEELRLHQSAIRTFQKLLANRKSIINDIFTFRNIQETKRQAQKAQIYAKNMEDLSAVMFKIARKTEKETVAMKIITLVTLFFLPATFTATLMSTDIVKFTAEETSGSPHKVFSSGALQIFVAVAFPLMTLTLLAWWMCDRRARRKSKQRLEAWKQSAMD